MLKQKVRNPVSCIEVRICQGIIQKPPSIESFLFISGMVLIKKMIESIPLCRPADVSVLIHLLKGGGAEQVCEKFFIVILIVYENVSIRVCPQYGFRKSVWHLVQPCGISGKADERFGRSFCINGTEGGPAVFFVFLQKSPVFGKGDVLKFFRRETVLCQGK